MNKTCKTCTTVEQVLHVLLQLLVVAAIILSFKFYCNFYCMFYFTCDRCFSVLSKQAVGNLFIYQRAPCSLENLTISDASSDRNVTDRCCTSLPSWTYQTGVMTQQKPDHIFHLNPQNATWLGLLHWLQDCMVPTAWPKVRRVGPHVCK